MLLRRLITTLLAIALASLPAVSLADSAGALSENELNEWVSQVLRDSAEETPSNAPIGEESLTEDGYAYLYSFATLYYDRPTLDENSALQAIVLTDERYPAPRGVCLGSHATMILESFGWKNPTLLGDGLTAALYSIDELPRAAYWSLAQLHEDGLLYSVQCAVQVMAGENRYTDAGLSFTLDGGKVSSIRVYGLQRFVSEADVKSNLQAMRDIRADGAPIPTASGYTVKHDAKPFSQADLRFGGMDVLNLKELGVKTLFGESQSEDKVRDDTGDWLLTTHRDGLTLSYVISADGEQSRLDTLSLTKDLVEGPRGLRVGVSTLAQCIAAFGSDGEGRMKGDMAILYGNGDTEASGFLTRSAEGGVALRYVTDVTGGYESPVTMSLSFVNDILTELLIYTW